MNEREGPGLEQRAQDEARAGESSEPGSDRTSWSSTLDVELQRDLMEMRLFDGAPVTINRFIVEKLLGAGASAAVYATRDPLLDRRVAIKVLAHPRDGRLVEATARVIREARALAQLSHPNIVSIYEVGQWNGRPFIAMELIEGMTLASWLAAEPRTVTEICETFLQAGRGLAAAHARGRVHRDFKPANVLVADDGRVVVSDFGLAGEALPPPPSAASPPAAPPVRAAGSGARELVVPDAEEDGARSPAIGTPAYAAPEQRAGVEAHPSADVYSFAIALVEALLGFHPGSAAAASSAAMSSPASPTTTSLPWQAVLRARVPRGLYAPLCAAAEPEVQLRSASLAPLLEALSARTASRRIQRRRMVAVGALALLFGLALALLVTSWLAPRRQAPPQPIAPREVGAPVFSSEPEARPLVLAGTLRALLDTPLALRDERWRQSARSLLMLPVPMEIPCRWPSPPRTQAILGDHVVALDLRGDVYACELATARITRLAGEARCIQPDDRSALAVVLTSGATEIHYLTGLGWEREVAVAREGSPASSGTRTEGSGKGGSGVADATELADVADIDGYCSFGGGPPRSARWTITSYSSASRASATSADKRQLFLSPWKTLLYRRGFWQMPRLLARGVTQFRADESLRRVVIVNDELTVVELDTYEAVAQPNPSRYPRAGLRVQLSREGDVAVAASLDGPLWWWRRGDPAWRTVDVPLQTITWLALSPRGQMALLDDNGNLQALELGTGRRYPLADSQVRRARFLDEDQVVATDATGRVWRWSLAAQRSFIVADHPGTGALWGLAVSPDASVLASSSSSNDDLIRLSSLASPSSGIAPAARAQRALRVAAGAGVHALLFDRERLLAGSNDGVWHRWDWRSQRSLGEVQLPRAWVWSAAVARPEGGEPIDVLGMGRLGRLGGGGGVGPQSSLKWGGSPVLLARGDAAQTVFTAARVGNTGIDDLAVSPDGKLVAAAASSGEIAVVDLITGKVVASRRAHLGEARRVRFSADGSRVISAGDDGTLRIWSLVEQSGQRTLEVDAQPYIAHGQIYELEVLGSVALVGSSDGALSAWDLISRRLIQEYVGHSKAISSARFDAGGHWLASSDLSGRLCLRPRASAECHTLLLGHQPGVAIRNLRFLPDGRLATSSDDRTVRLWTPSYDLDDDALVQKLQRYVFPAAE
jgi:eukaryotic-like serine/threonine-protein kinase